MSHPKAPISERALLARINRKLGKDNETLRRCRSDSRGYSSLGDYYRIDIYRNAVIDTHVDLVTLGKELAVMGHW